MPIICVFGDSTAWGAYDLEKGGWVNRLWFDFIKKDEGETEIYNLSISGGTTETILARFESEAKIRRADTLIFQTGGNDAAYDKNTKESLVPADQFEKNIETIIKRAKALTENIIFISFKNCDESKTVPVSWCDLCYTNELIEEYNNIMKNVCNKYDIKFIDIFGLLDNSDFEDGLHPNAAGHKKIFEVVKKQIF
ncbi:MAG: GDSL-type esterase/lipase family protein [Patescibacteria group bacterium]